MSVAASVWLKAKTAADRLGVTVYQIHRLALAGRIRTKIEPGRTPWFHVEDVDRIATETKQAEAATAQA